MIKTVVGSFDAPGDAYQTARALREAGFLESDLNVVGSNSKVSEKVLAVDSTPRTADTASEGTAAGVVTGSAVGAATGLAISLLGLTIPGVGLILAAGPIAAALAGAGAGAVAGGLIGGFTDLGMTREDAESYSEVIRRGGAIVTLRADDSRVAEAEEILRRHRAFDIRDRVVRWQGEGWRGYDADAQPFTAEQTAADRKRNPST